MEDNFDDLEPSMMDEKFSSVILNESSAANSPKKALRSLFPSNSNLSPLIIRKADYTEQIPSTTIESNLEESFNILNLQEFDTIPLSLKIIYSLPAFSKMSCLVLLK